MEIDDETGNEGDSSASIAEDAMKVSDRENIPSAHTYNHTSRLWQRGNFRPILFSFQDNTGGITVDLAENKLLGFFKVFIDQKRIQMITDKTDFKRILRISIYCHIKLSSVQLILKKFLFVWRLSY